MAGGMPSSARQILATDAALAAVISNPGRTARPLGEQPHRGVVIDGRGGNATPFGLIRRYGGIRRERQRAYGPERLPGDGKRLAAGGQDADVRAGGQDRPAGG
jgi:hypothetical protein